MNAAAVTELVPMLGEPELDQLRHARKLLENPGLAAQLANAVGAPMEYVMARRLPASVTKLIDTTTRKALASWRTAKCVPTATTRRLPASTAKGRFGSLATSKKPSPWASTMRRSRRDRCTSMRLSLARVALEPSASGTVRISPIAVWKWLTSTAV